MENRKNVKKELRERKKKKFKKNLENRIGITKVQK
jgi:hypothetical protein